MRYSTKQVCEIVGQPKSWLKSYTRFENRRAPLFTPSYPAQGTGHRDYYSFEDLIILKIMATMSRQGFGRAWLKLVTKEIKKFKLTEETDLSISRIIDLDLGEYGEELKGLKGGYVSDVNTRLFIDVTKICQNVMEQIK